MASYPIVRGTNEPTGGTKAPRARSITEAETPPTNGDKLPRVRSITEAETPPTNGDKHPRVRSITEAETPPVRGSRYHNPTATSPSKGTHVYRSGRVILVEDDTA